MRRNDLATILQDYDFAWELLDSQIAIQMSQSLNGDDIARMLQLYMRGVEKMNSILDVRESYFRNKMASLMGRTNVIRSLNRPPMAKKEKPLEGVSKPKGKSAKQAINQYPTKPYNNHQQLIPTTTLQQRKKQIQLRLAYEAEQHSTESLRKLLAVQNQREQKLINKIENNIKSQEEVLNERLMKRKLKTSTFRSRPDEPNQIMLELNRNNDFTQKSRKKMMDYQFLPQLKVSKSEIRRSYKSVEQKYRNRLLEQSQSPKLVRKSFGIRQYLGQE